MNKFLILIILYFFCTQFVIASQYDTSIDAEIRKQYNLEALPPLPNVPPSKISMPKEAKNCSSKGKTYTIKNGTKITLISKTAVSNWNKEGAKISFLSQNQIITKEGTIIPSGTIFKASIINSHPPQITGNGGLIELRVNEIHYNGIMSAINTKIDAVNSKNIFGNRIKGKRKYWKNCAKAMTPGKKTFSTMKKTYKKLSPYPVINIFGIIPLTIGGVVYLVNVPAAPIASIFMKGSSISIPAETAFQIHILGNNQIRG